LELDPEQFDLARFRRLREHAGPDPASAAVELKEAMALWRGPALAEFASEPFAQAERLRLEEERLEALEKRIDAELALGRHATLVGELEALVATQPLRERLPGQPMLALYHCGRQAKALAVYQEGRVLLVEELGIEPGRVLQRVQLAILGQDLSLELVRDEVAAESRRGIFVGREPELQELSEGLSDVFAGHGRLFLLVGEPGIGKSWLADEVLARARARGARVLVGRCWEAGGARPRTGRGCNRFAPTFTRLRLRGFESKSAPAGRLLRCCFPSCANCSPISLSGRRPSQRVPGSACSRRRRRSCGRRLRRARSSCSWTISMRRMSPRCCCCVFWPVRWAAAGC
jgi:hypothetical protein